MTEVNWATELGFALMVCTGIICFTWYKIIKLKTKRGDVDGNC